VFAHCVYKVPTKIPPLPETSGVLLILDCKLWEDCWKVSIIMARHIM